MAELAQTVTPQGLLAVCRFIDVPLADLVAARPRLVAVLANVRDPGNAGTVLRTADAAGADGGDLHGRLGRPVQQQVRARRPPGSLFHLPVVTGAEPADGGRRAARGRADGCSPPTAAPVAVLDARGGPDLTGRPRGCSGTRPGACPPTCSRWPTRRSPCRSTAGPRA